MRNRSLRSISFALLLSVLLFSVSIADARAQAPVLEPAAVPAYVPLAGIQAVAAGGSHTCALTTGGGVKCWGWDVYGQLGDQNAATYSDTPVNVTGLASGVTAIDAGGSSTCALIEGGAVKCWGSNDLGQLGIDPSTTFSSDTPVTVSGLGSVKAIAVGAGHACVLPVSGGAKCWGSNNQGELGDGNKSVDSYVPVSVSIFSRGLNALALGGSHSCVLISAGSVRCWGWSADGQLGNNSTDSFDTPVKVLGLDTGITAITAGIYHSCAVTDAGTVKCWGDNSQEQLGHDGALSDSLIPLDVVGLGNWIEGISAGSVHTCALTTDDGVKCWGGNQAGQLGDGTAVERSVPVDVITAATCYELLRTHSGQGSDPVPTPKHTLGCPTDHYPTFDSSQKLFGFGGGSPSKNTSTTWLPSAGSFTVVHPLRKR